MTKLVYLQHTRSISMLLYLDLGLAQDLIIVVFFEE